MEQTAVEWLVDEMIKRKFFEKETELSYTTLEHLTNQAKEIQKEQIIDAYHKGCADQLRVYPDAEYNSEQYYNETFKK